MRILSRLPFVYCLIAFAAGAPAAGQVETPGAVPCRELPCAVTVDWTRAGGVAAQVPDRRYGNAGELERRVKARLNELGFTDNASANGQALRILLVPAVGRAMCDELAGTATDMSCQAISDVQARLEGPEAMREDVDLPSRIRNRCASDKTMPVDQFAAFVGDWIVYALEGRSKGERRPVARC